MKTMTITKINDLIDLHPGSYYECRGCKYCKEIEKVSKENGLWLGDGVSKQIHEGKKRARNFTKEELKPYLDQGLSIREISRREGFHESTVSKKIKQWFPEYIEKKKADVMPFDKYVDLRKQGYSDSEIAKKIDVSYMKLWHQVAKWRKTGKFSEGAI